MRGIKVDGTHDLPGCLDVFSRGVPLVVAGHRYDMAQGFRAGHAAARSVRQNMGCVLFCEFL